MLDLVAPRVCYFAFGNKIVLFIGLFVVGVLFAKQIKLLLSKRWVHYLLILFIPTVIFVKLLLNDPFFLSDDFAHLSLINDNGYLSIVSMALGNSGIWIGHHIISGFWLFKVIYDLFGVNVYPYTFAVFLLVATNVVLLYKMLTKISGNKLAGVLIATIVYSSQYLGWISNIHELLGALFALITLNLWFSWLDKLNNKYLYLSLITYLFAMFSKEVTFLLYPVLIMLTFFYHFYVKRVEIKKVLIKSVPLGIIFFVYFFTYAFDFTSYFSITKGVGYSMSFIPANIFGNLIYYLGVITPVYKLWLIASLFIVIGLLFKGERKKVYSLLILLGAYIIFLFPALLFVNRTSIYYSYIPSIFLFMFIAIIVNESLDLLLSIIQKERVGYVVNTLVILVILIGGFSLSNTLLDNCYLIQYPWKNESKKSLFSAVELVQNSFKGDNSDRLGLSEVVKKDDVVFVVESGVFNLFLDEQFSEKYSFTYNYDEDVIVIEEKRNDK
ncbi:glycosyltransferase family 39 protein [Patescibacteria group bacterium]